MTCMCGDAQCPSCGKAQGTYEDYCELCGTEITRMYTIVIIV